LTIVRHAHVPDRIPAVIAAVVVEPVAIGLHAGRIHRELVRRAAIVVRVDQDADPVARRIEIAACEIRDDLVRLGVERADFHEERGRIVRDAELRALARLAGVVRLALHERVDRRHRAPDFLAHLAARADRRRRRRRCSSRHGKCEGSEHHWSWDT
jgi:hypothetical protein